VAAIAVNVLVGAAPAGADGPQARGLPPAPEYIPGTIITPAKASETRSERGEPAPGKAGRQGRGERAAPLPAVAAGRDPAPAMERPERTTVTPAKSPVLAAEAVSTTDAAVWQAVLPHLPERGDFAILPESELTPLLVGKDEFDFCDDIKCYRSAAVIGAWNGGAFDRLRGEFRVHGGGHADYGGNEVYAFDFATLSWTRETDPQPLTGPFLRDSDGDGENDTCPAPAKGPPATHTYQGFLYVPKIDRYWLFGTVEYCSNAMGGSSAWEYDAHSKTWTAMPELNAFARFARTEIDRRSGNVIVHVGRKHGWHEIDPQTREVVRSFNQDPFGNYIDGPAVFDPLDGILYALVDGRSTDRLVAYDWPAPGQPDGFEGRLVAEWPKDGKKAWGLAQHASGLLVLWDGNARILVVDPRDGRSWEPSPGGDHYRSMGDGNKPGKVYSKWIYIPEIDAFFGITNPDLGIVLYRLGGAAGGSEAISQAASRGEDPPDELLDDVTLADEEPTDEALAEEMPARTVSAEGPSAQGLPTAAPRDNGRGIPLEIEESADWREICASAILCDPMGEGEVLYRGKVVDSGPPPRGKNWRSIGHKMGHPDSQAAVPDPEVGGLRFYFPSNTGSGAAGNYKTNFSPDYSFQVGSGANGAPAEEVYIQFQVRYSCSFIWTDCDPASPNYRKERRCFLSKRGDGDCTASKIALISTGDREDSRANACTRIQTAINHGTDHSLHAFHRCPRAQGFGERLPRVGGRYQGNSQPNGLFYCPRILDDFSQSGWNNTAESCFRLVDDRWITIQVRLRFGPPQGGAKKDEPRLSHASIWGGIEGVAGGRQRLVIDNDFYASTPESPRDFVGKIWLMPHLYNKTDQETHPPFQVWYRNLVISETLIPNPG
jgi:hypothetical protein